VVLVLVSVGRTSGTGMSFFVVFGFFFAAGDDAGVDEEGRRRGVWIVLEDVQECVGVKVDAEAMVEDEGGKRRCSKG